MRYSDDDDDDVDEYMEENNTYKPLKNNKGT